MGSLLKDMLKKRHRRRERSVDIPVIHEAGTDFGTQGEDTLETDINTLRDYSFISITPEGSTFEMHRLVQLAAQMWLRQTGRYRSWELRSLQLLNNAFPYLRYEQWKECYVLYPHAALVLKSNTQEQNALLLLATILYKAAWFADEQGLYVEAQLMARRSVDILKDMLGEEHASTLSSISNLALIYSDQGRPKEAEELEVRVLETIKAVLGARASGHAA